MSKHTVVVFGDGWELVWHNDVNLTLNSCDTRLYTEPCRCGNKNANEWRRGHADTQEPQDAEGDADEGHAPPRPDAAEGRAEEGREEVAVGKKKGSKKKGARGVGKPKPK